MKKLLIALVMVCATAFIGQAIAGDEHKA